MDYGSHDLSHAERVVYVGMTEYEHYFPITEMATVSAKVNSILQMYLNMVEQMNEESMAFDDFPVGF